MNSEQDIQTRPIKAMFGLAERSSRQYSLLDRVLNLKENILVNSAVVLVYLVIKNGSVPAHNELVYLLYLAKEWNPSFLSNDWTFSGPLPSHVIFNFIFGPLTLVLPLEIVGWIGRILAWSSILFALFQLGKYFRIPLWTITLAILLWLFYGQAVVGGEWIFGPFEAKGIAYALLFFSLNQFMHERGIVLPSILSGLAFSFHPVVGFWGGLAIGLSLIVLGYPVGAVVKSAFYTALFALPGLVPLLTTPLDESTAAWKFVALVVMPYHFDPFSFAPWKLLLLLVLFGFNWLHFRSDKENHVLRFLMSFQAILAVFFVLGFLARYGENYTVLKLMPCRLFPALIPLFFFFHLTAMLQQCRTTEFPKALLAGGFAVLIALGIPVKLYRDYTKRDFREDPWMQKEVDLTKTLEWVAKNTPTDAVFILPPWRKDGFYVSQRAQIANWWVLRTDRLTEWRQRLEMVAGDLSSLTDGTEKANMRLTVAHYNHLTRSDIAIMERKFGADYLVSSTAYGYPVLFNAGSYKVYSLKRSGRSAERG